MIKNLFPLHLYSSQIKNCTICRFVLWLQDRVLLWCWEGVVLWREYRNIFQVQPGYKGVLGNCFILVDLLEDFDGWICNLKPKIDF